MIFIYALYLSVKTQIFKKIVRVHRLLVFSFFLEVVLCIHHVPSCVSLRISWLPNYKSSLPFFFNKISFSIVFVLSIGTWNVMHLLLYVTNCLKLLFVCLTFETWDMYSIGPVEEAWPVMTVLQRIGDKKTLGKQSLYSNMLNNRFMWSY